MIPQAKIAKAIGKSQAAISRYINGIRSPSIETAKMLQKVTGIQASDWRMSEPRYLRGAVAKLKELKEIEDER